MTAHTLTRLRAMTVWELADRGRQEVLKRVDRLPLRTGQTDPRMVLEQYSPTLANPASALDALRATLPRRFFAGLSEPGIAQLLDARADDQRREVVAAA